VATNAAGRATSAVASLTVQPAARLANLSVRTSLAERASLAVGIVVSGGSRDVLVRGAGPALGAFGLTGVLADPRLEYFRDGTRVASNDDWIPSLSAVFARVGAFAFPTGSRDAALGQSLAGAGTIRISGEGSGVVLVEAYDAGGNPSARIVNLSALNRIGAGNDSLIAGFFVSGSGVLRVAIRAAGPALGAFGVAQPLADPRLTLRDARGTVLVENDNWDAALAPALSRVGAAAFPTGSRDAALIATLAAGSSYTVQVAGTNGGTGEALVEIFELP
jgi:hypothetical protein